MRYLLPFLSLLALFPSIAIAAAPTVGSITATDPITLTEDSAVTVSCNATITDTDGYADISGVNATLWDPAATTEAAADNNNNHYTNTTCGLSGGSGNTINAACEFPIQYYANPAEWTCKLIAIDTTDATGSNNTATVTVNELKAIDVSSTLAFGTMSLGDTTTNAAEPNITITNTGNAMINITIDGYGASDGDGNAMACDAGGSEISLSNLRYNLTASQDFDDNMTALTDSAITVDINLAKTTDGSASTEELFCKLKIPSTDVGGSCTGTIVITAV